MNLDFIIYQMIQVLHLIIRLIHIDVKLFLSQYSTYKVYGVTISKIYLISSKVLIYVCTIFLTIKKMDLSCHSIQRISIRPIFNCYDNNQLVLLN
jgi:hypothetical protein